MEFKTLHFVQILGSLPDAYVTQLLRITAGSWLKREIQKVKDLRSFPQKLTSINKRIGKLLTEEIKKRSDGENYSTIQAEINNQEASAQSTLFSKCGHFGKYFLS